MLLEDRKAQLFPTLTPRQRAFAIRFASGAARRFEAGEKVFDVGDRNAGVWLVAEGGIIASRRDGLGREQLFATCGPGQFSGEIGELGGQASLAAARAAPEGCVAYPFDAAASARPRHRERRDRRTHDAGLHSPSRRLAGGRKRRIGRPWRGGFARHRPPSRAAVTEQLSAFPDRCGGSGGQSSHRAARRACGRFADPDLSERNGVETSERCRGRGWPWHHSRSSARRRVRCDRRRCRTGRPRDSRLCRIRRPLGSRARQPLVWRTGWRFLKDRELLGLSDGHFRPSAYSARLYSGPEIRSAIRGPRLGRRARLLTPAACTASRSTEAYRSMDGRW